MEYNGQNNPIYVYFDHSTVAMPPPLPQHRETRFRQPSQFEQALGLWVDRIGDGEQSNKKPPSYLRQLGQYAAVAIQSGSGNLYLASGRIRAVNPGDVIVHHPDQGIDYSPSGRWNTCWVVWNGPEASALEKLRLLPPDLEIAPGSAEAVRLAHQSLEPLMQRADATAALRRKQLILDLILRLQQDGEGGKSDADDFMRQVVSWLETKGDNPVAIPELARHFHASPTHFRRIFRSRTGRSPVEFINAWRVQRAQQLLSAGGTIKDAAAKAGFRDIFYFMRVFKQVTGLTAGEFARRPSNLP
jgi:AraC-like DNA-binding protein